jgi:hypothetical protein
MLILDASSATKRYRAYEKNATKFWLFVNPTKAIHH